MKKNTLLIIGLAAVGVGYYLWKNKDDKKELKSSVTGTGDGNKKCPCIGVKSNDGFGKPTTLYSIACCKKAASMESNPIGGLKNSI